MSWEADEVRIREFGGPEQMRLEKVTLRDVGPGEVLLKQDAIGINFVDTYHRRGLFPIGELPRALGVEAAGIVEAVGEGVTRVQIGDRISYPRSVTTGSYASRRIMPERMLMRLPEGISNEVAAAISLQGMTVHMLLKGVRELKPGNTILVHSAAGGLGLLLVQWAKSIGVRVIGTVGSPEKAELAKSVGADETILYKEVDFAEATKELTKGEGVDVVYEGVGGDTLKRSLAVIKPFGLAVNLGQVGGPLPTLDLADLGPYQSLSVCVPGLSPYLKTLPDIQVAADELFGQILSGALKVHIGAQFPLAAAADAHRLIESGKSMGSVILEA
ncbi:quinone oxidoreductase [Paraburkholderia sp. RL18-101-BIB-B]|uniref:quinone oxidoreductase family protein n=1 Tax=Paraburkholderia sp. RL18-101-BIB-B TaxID=3031634 RepID=UPI0038BA905C